MRKQERQRFISKIIRENEVFKQEDLVALLIEKNIPKISKPNTELST